LPEALRRLFPLAAVSLCALLCLPLSCGGTGPGGPPDSGQPDSGSDAGADAGPMATILDPSARPAGLTVDSFNAYWSDGAGAVREVELLPGGQEAVLASGLQAPQPIAERGDYLYVGGLANDGGVWRVPKTGGAAEPIDAHENYVQAIALDDTRVWWTSFAQPSVSTTARIRSAPLAGGAAVTLASGFNYGRALAVDAAALYLASAAGISRVDKATGAVTSVSTVARPTLSIAVDDTSVYFGDRDSGAIMKAPKTGGAGVSLGPLPQEPSDVFLDKATGTLYVSLFATIGSGRFGGVYKVRTAGGEAPVLVGKTFGIASFGQSPLVVSGSTVYFGAGALWQVPK
jgi:hypothetical protein